MRRLLERGAGVRTREYERRERTRTKNSYEEMLEVEPAMWLFLRLLSIVMTVRRREESVHKYLAEAGRANHEGRAAPSLLPISIPKTRTAMV